MKPIIVNHPEQVLKRLSEMSLTPEAVMDIIDAMVLALRNTTLHDVNGAGGTRAYLDGTRRARDVGKGLGWEPNRRGNVESMIHVEKRLRLITCNADERAGEAEIEVSNKNPKGPVTANLIARNLEQAVFEGLLDEVGTDLPPIHPNVEDYTNWYLFVFANDKTYKAELACPTSAAGGQLMNHLERIMLVIDGDNLNNLRQPAPQPDLDDSFDIIITRKGA